jgi:hypothetical protein
VEEMKIVEKSCHEGSEEHEGHEGAMSEPVGD